MKQFKLTPSFYIIFSLVLAIPASYIATITQSYLNSLSADNILQRLASMGVIEAPTTVAILLIVFLLIDRWAWRIKGLSSVFGIPHDINGRYEGSLVSSYDESKTYGIVIEIKQFLTEVRINLYTENSASYSIVGTIGKNFQENWSIAYLYQNNTNTVNHDEDMKDHGGAAFLEIFEEGSLLKGNYFNNPRDRGRHGSIEVKRVSGKRRGCFK